MEKILDFYRQRSAIGELFENIEAPKSRMKLKGLSGSLPSVLGALFSMRSAEVVNLFVVSDKEAAFYFMNDIEALLGEGEKELAQKRAIKEAENEEAALAEAAEELDLDVNAVKDMYAYYDFDMTVRDSDIDAMTATMQFMLDNGMIEKAVDISSIVIR